MVVAGMYEQEIVAYALFGILLNFLISMLFTLYLSKNIGLDEMIKSMGAKRQNPLIKLALFIPYAKVLITLYRVAILQLYFLNRGYSHKEYWIYLTHDDKIKE